MSAAAMVAPPPTCRDPAPMGLSGQGGPDIDQYLESAVRAIEGSFLAAGDVLSVAVEGVGDLIAALGRLTDALDSSMVASTAENLELAATSLRELPRSLSARRAALMELTDLGGSLDGSIADMSESLAYLRVFAVYVKIAAGGVRDPDQQFMTFAGEIADCIEAGRTHLAALKGDLKALDADLRAALRLEGGVVARCDDMLPAIPDAIVSSASALADHRGKIASAAQSVATLAKSVRAKVGGVLSALQIGDITRQRLEHIQQGLRLVDSIGGKLSASQRPKLEAIARELLIAQLASASDDFHDEVAIIAHNMQGLAANAEEILSLLASAYGSSEGDQGFLGRLEAHVDEAFALVGEVQTADQAAVAIGRSAVKAAHRLSTRIDDIQRLQREVQQMAFNTRLKCSQIGSDGRPLAVIALELREHAMKLEVSAARALTGITGLDQGAARLAIAAGSANETGAQLAATALSGAVGKIRQAGQAVDADLVTLAQQGASVVRTLQNATIGLDFERAIGSSLDEARTALGERSDIGLPCSEGIEGILQDYLVEMAKIYTMAQERSVHQAILKAHSVGDPAPASPPEASPPENVDDLLF